MTSLRIVLGLLMFVLSFSAQATEPGSPLQEPASHTDMSVMEAFAAQQAEEGEAVKISDQEKHRWLFIMGAALLILLLTTAALGIAMAIYGKQVFVAHMLTAGFSVTLAIAHAVAAIVWFNPF